MNKLKIFTSKFNIINLDKDIKSFKEYKENVKNLYYRDFNNIVGKYLLDGMFKKILEVTIDDNYLRFYVNNIMKFKLHRKSKIDNDLLFYLTYDL